MPDDLGPDLLVVVARGAWRSALHAHPELWRLAFEGTAEQIASARLRHSGLNSLYATFGPPPLDLAGTSAPGAQIPNELPFDEGHALTPAQLAAFAADGFIVLPGAVSEELVHAALRRINGAIGEGKLVDEAGGLKGVAPEIRTTREMMDLLYRSLPLATAVQSLLGRGRVAPVRTAQVALRFPAADTPGATGGTDWHIDGFGKGQHSPFTLLCGVCLSDAPDAGYGNLAVHAGCHRSLQAEVKAEVEAGSALFSLSRDAEPSRSESAKKPDLGRPQVISMRAGDAVLAHQKLPHLGTPNASPHVRYMCYFRVRHCEHNALKERWLDDVMLPFEGLLSARALSSSPSSR